MMNVASKRMGKKDIIKIEDFTEIDTAMLGLIDTAVTVNIIENEHVVEKMKLSIPREVKGLFPCGNPRCVSNTDAYVTPTFHLHDEPSCSYTCEYCEEITRVEIL